MFGHDVYDDIKLGIQVLPFRSYVDYEVQPIVEAVVNVVYISGPKTRMQCIVIEKDGRYMDFYYNGSEECFKQLSEEGEFHDWWEEEEVGEPTPEMIRNGVCEDILVELGIRRPKNV